MGMVEIARALQLGGTINAALASMEDERQAEATKKHHMRLGELIQALERVDQSKICIIEGSIDGNPNAVDSYRGYYTDLGIEPDADRDVLVFEVVRMLKDAVFNVYHGYKGGDYLMQPETLVWVAEYGTCNDDCVSGVIEEPYAVVIVTSKSEEL